MEWESHWITRLADLEIAGNVGSRTTEGERRMRREAGGVLGVSAYRAVNGYITYEALLA
jgi:hypothetical protein